MAVSKAVKICAVNLSKMCNDLRLLSSGPKTGFGEINLPAKQNGSSIMPGKTIRRLLLEEKLMSEKGSDFHDPFEYKMCLTIRLGKNVRANRS